MSTPEQLEIGIVGLGQMGGNMARGLLEKGFTVTGSDISEDARAQFEEYGGTPVETPAEASENADIIVTSLPKSQIVESVYLGEDGILSTAKEGTVALEMSTINPETSEKVAAEAKEQGVEFLASPVSGGPEDCHAGTLTIMVGGDEDVFHRNGVQTVLDAMSQKLYHVGDVGAGPTVKLINNVMSHSNMLIAMEAVALGRDRGVEGDVMLDVIGNAGGGSNQFKKRMPRVLNRNFDPGFTVDLTTKDLGIALDMADSSDYPMYVVNLVRNLYQTASARGLGSEDFSSVVKLYEEHTNSIVDAPYEVDESFGGY
ncbi:NAD(P)-dependent oxidoreductase (plasmid) [Salinigranum rubrum]|uniref:NAD(P)-dependent oxidoreductase n=1 Tax=Salinigranum rubrum TaxID=755307 RepID=A0A2I8VRY5_9EURY|nr:NAD(P)-dependent oxidoreductase [Salinigranum rubrum]AUV84665.1 NAD(P)-dependent oxidoreductase [Salinigranum rubrum]